MQKVQVKTLSLLYHPKEDRMMLLINKDDIDAVSYWITRKFYFSMLFEFDNFLDTLDVRDRVPPPKQSVIKSEEQESAVSKMNDGVKVSNEKERSPDLQLPQTMLESVNINLMQDKSNMVFTFKKEDILAQTTMNQNDFIGFYDLMKRSFPKGEWGIM